ncbi:hypothetical protein [Pedobacter aquatilis]|uniref:hypothetical protein n=1 Tax=Pedobacter aquatilis TaxID=351343 RepID=UPI00292FC85D|nr:hypothetical protein [Pedobacter aquatilis]
MFSNPKTGTRIVVFNNRTIVVSRVETHPNQFRIYVDGIYKGILTLKDGEWSHTAGFSLPKGVFTLLVKRIGIGSDVQGI